MTALLSGSWPMIITALLGLAGVVFGMFKHQKSKTSEAEAATQAAKASSALKDADVARTDAEAATAALKAIQEATDTRVAVDVQVTGLPVGQAEKELRNEFQRD